MDEKNRNIDKILLNKAYNELSAEEFLVVKKEITSESEYNDLRAMLLVAAKEINSVEEIEPKSETKAFLMNEFTKAYPAKQNGAGGLGFLFPKDRAFYQRPGYQILAVAAVLVLIFTIYPKLTSNMTSKDEVAQHNVSEPNASQVQHAEEKLDELDSEGAVEMEASEKSLTPGENESLEQTSTLVADNSNMTTEISEKEVSNTFSGNVDKGGYKDQTIASDEIQPAEEALAKAEEEPGMSPMTDIPNNADTWYESAEADDGLAVESPMAAGSTGEYKASEVTDLADFEERNEDTDLDANTGANVSSNELSFGNQEELQEEVAILESSKDSKQYRNNKKVEAENVTVVKVKSLSENAELIDLFYTAM